MISKPWIRTNLTVIAQANTSGYTLPSYEQRQKHNYAHRQLHDSDVWDDLDVLWILAQDGGENYARINHKSPSTFLCTLVNSPTFTTNEGFKSNGTTSYVDTNWAPSDGVNFTQDDASYFCYIVDDIQGSFAFGSEDTSSATKRVYLQPRSVLDTRAFGLNSVPTFPGTVASDGHGAWYLERTNSTTGQLYINNIADDNMTTTSATRSTKSVFICALHVFDGSVSSYYTADVAFLCFGKAMTSTKRTALYNALHGYFDSL
jgi:hypothetical protein